MCYNTIDYLHKKEGWVFTLFIAIAVFLRLLAGAAYIHAVLTDKAKPHVVSWFFWGLTALIAFGIQLSQGVGAPALVTLALGVGPLTVFVLALSKGLHRVMFTRTDKWCAALTAVGIALWIVTKNPIAALWMSIIADFISSIPTIIKCCRHPHTERALPYALSAVSMVITVASLQQWTLATALFPVYILGINLLFTFLIAVRIGPRLRVWRRSFRLKFVPEETGAEGQA